VLAFLSPVLHVLRNSHPFPQICRYNQNIGLPLVAVSSLVLGNETGQTLLVWRMKMPGPHPHFGKKLHHLPEYMVPHVLYCIPPWSVNSGVGILKPWLPLRCGFFLDSTSKSTYAILSIRQSSWRWGESDTGTLKIYANLRTQWLLHMCDYLLQSPWEHMLMLKKPSRITCKLYSFACPIRLCMLPMLYGARSEEDQRFLFC
jgi:hypothetical protein